ncbi:MAG: penicillin-binding protein 1A [Pelagibacterales bacterium]|nr:penicillin-binding protein 1A [Pelagibacterales bacterium]
MKKLAKSAVIFSMLSMFFGSIAILVLIKKNSENLPDYEQLKSYTPLITTRLYASDGSLINEFSKEKRVFVPITNIPKNLINAFLAAEDAKFYKHSGIDPFAIFRTSINNAFSLVKGDHMGGASTITQQVVKNFLLSNERTIQRKIKEAILAFRMTKSFTKDQILELYLNQIYLGSGAYGVAVAAETYFDKSIDELTIEEDALLATLPKAPSKLDPRKNMEKAKARRDWVIERMQEEGFITSKEAEEAIAKPITLKEQNYTGYNKAEFFSDSVKKELTELYGSDDVFENGIVVRTTLDTNLQKVAEAALDKGIEEYDQKHGYRGALSKLEQRDDWQSELQKFDVKKLYKDSWKKAVVLSLTKDSAAIGIENGDLGSIELSSVKWARKYISINALGPVVKKIDDVFKVGDVILVEKTEKAGNYILRQIPEVNGAFLAIDPHSGRVLAMMGGYVDAPNQFNRATQAMRQPGSTMKTFGYIAALENGMTPASVIMDEEITLNQGSDLPPYKPTNYSGQYYGPTTLRTGLETSRNVTTVKMADQIGLDKIVDVVKRFGVNDNPQKIYSLVLGSTETSLLRIVSAYAMIVNGGHKITPSMIEKIQDRNGSTVYRRDKRNCENCLVKDGEPYLPVLDETKEKITDSATAYQITSMLQGVVERGTAGRAKSIGKIIAGKTGTTNSSYDSWFVGFSPDLVAGVYVGFDMPKSLGSDETGASVALPIFIDFMKQALKDSPSKPFRVPNTVKFVKIDRSTGKFPNASTPKDRVFLEAFKLNDSMDLESTENEEETSEKTDSGSDPVGIY